MINIRSTLFILFFTFNALLFSAGGVLLDPLEALKQELDANAKDVNDTSRTYGPSSGNGLNYFKQCLSLWESQKNEALLQWIKAIITDFEPLIKKEDLLRRAEREVSIAHSAFLVVTIGPLRSKEITRLQITNLAEASAQHVNNLLSWLSNYNPGQEYLGRLKAKLESITHEHIGSLTNPFSIFNKE